MALHKQVSINNLSAVETPQMAAGRCPGVDFSQGARRRKAQLSALLFSLHAQAASAMPAAWSHPMLLWQAEVGTGDQSFP